MMMMILGTDDASTQELPEDNIGKRGRFSVSQSSVSGAINEEEASLPIPVPDVASTRLLTDGNVSGERQSRMARLSQSINATVDGFRVTRSASASAQRSPCETVAKKRRTAASVLCQSQAMNHDASLPIPESTNASADITLWKASRKLRSNASCSCRLEAIIDDEPIPITGSTSAPAGRKRRTSVSRSSQSQAMDVAVSLSTPAPAQGLLHEIICRKHRTNVSWSSQSRAVNDEACLPIPESSNALAQRLPVESVGGKLQMDVPQSSQSQSHGVNDEASVPLPESTDTSAQALPDETFSSAVGSTSIRKRTWGKTRNIQLLLLPNGQKLPLEFNKHGQPIGLHASKFSSYLGNLVRNGGDAPISLLHWENVTEETREKIYARLLEKFEFAETPLIKERIMQKMGKKFCDHKYHLKHDYYDKYETTEERLANVPEGISKNDWAAFVSYHDMEETKEKCAKNKCNRAKQVIPHYTGSKSYAQIRAEEAKKDPELREPSQLKMFRIAYTKKNGSVGSSAAQEILEKFENLSNQSEDSSSSKREDEIYRQIIGPERHGRVRGFGLGPTPSSVFGNTPSRTELMNQLREASERNDELQSRIRELEKKIEDDRKKMEEQKKKAEEDRSKMDLLFSIVEEMRARPR
ncbi:uncharacterized protein LOC116188084 isoform X2 [Punica granatum]|uniref:Uncharacterized protein LOC116188084 isoform X2 n=1 Tax=Punica granatum TaxID=22663 RepID=A0A6P8BSD6_PUNGR|nr:uncharacterized protein LOC116188084 isoform X2 [Punica granatum]